MRVCMIAYTFYEGDNRVMRYAETLAKRGDEVDIICLRSEGRTGLSTRNGVRVLQIQKRITNEKSQFSYLFRIMLFFIRAMFRVSLNHLRKPYRLIHVHSVPDFLVFTAWIPRLTGAKIILDIHDLLPELYASKFQRSPQSLIFRAMLGLEKISAAFADHVIVPNHLWQDRVVSRSVPAWKCSVFMNYPDTTMFFSRGRTRHDNRIIFLYPGTLGWHQGLDIAISAFVKIKDILPGSEFHIYGQGPVMHSLMQQAKDAGVQDRVLFQPCVPIWEIAQIIENSDMAVVPKRKDGFGNEAFSTKTLEFMAVGVPVIVSDTAVDRYYFDDHIVTFFRGGDADDLATQMLRLARDPQLRQKQSEKANEFIARNNWDVRKSTYLDLVDSLTEVRTRPTPTCEGTKIAR